MFFGLAEITICDNGAIIRSYHDGYTASHSNCVVKHHWAQLVLWWGTTREPWVLYVSQLFVWCPMRLHDNGIICYRILARFWSKCGTFNFFWNTYWKGRNFDCWMWLRWHDNEMPVNVTFNFEPFQAYLSRVLLFWLLDCFTFLMFDAITSQWNDRLP